MVKPKPKTPADLAAFVQAAPDSAKPADGEAGRMTQITLRLDARDLALITTAAKKARMPRAAFIRSRVMAGLD